MTKEHKTLPPSFYKNLISILYVYKDECFTYTIKKKKFLSSEDAIEFACRFNHNLKRILVVKDDVTIAEYKRHGKLWFENGLM